MCVLELRSCNTTCTVLCLWSWDVQELQDCLVLQQCSWHPERDLATTCRLFREMALPSISPCSKTWKTCIMRNFISNVCILHRQSTDLISLALGDRKKSFGLCFCYQAPASPNCFHVRSRQVSRADSIYGCAGSSIPMERHVRVTSHGVTQSNRIAASLKISILDPVRSSGQTCTLHQDPVFLIVCSASFEVRSWRILWHRAVAPPMSGSIAEKKHACPPLRSLVPPAISPPSTIDL